MTAGAGVRKAKNPPTGNLPQQFWGRCEPERAEGAPAPVLPKRDRILLSPALFAGERPGEGACRGMRRPIPKRTSSTSPSSFGGGASLSERRGRRHGTVRSGFFSKCEPERAEGAQAGCGTPKSHNRTPSSSAAPGVKTQVAAGRAVGRDGPGGTFLCMYVPRKFTRDRAGRRIVDIPRARTGTHRRRYLYVAAVAAVLFVATVAVARMGPAAPRLDGAAVWTD